MQNVLPFPAPDIDPSQGLPEARSREFEVDWAVDHNLDAIARLYEFGPYAKVVEEPTTTQTSDNDSAQRGQVRTDLLRAEDLRRHIHDLHKGIEDAKVRPDELKEAA